MKTDALLPETLRSLAVTEREGLSRYETPERGATGHTAFALLPRTEQDVGFILAEASRSKTPLVISAGRTGLVEAQCPQGEGVLSLEKLDAPLRFGIGNVTFDFAGLRGEHAVRALYEWWNGQAERDLATAWLEVQAGIAVDAVNALLEPLKLMWPMEMGSSSAASAGACVANASAGANAVCYGAAAHLCERAWGYWADGQPAGPFAGPRWRSPQLDELAIDSTRVNVDWGLIGSQGLFGVITGLRLRLYSRPTDREGVLMPVADMPTAVELLRRAHKAFPDHVEEFEFIGRGALERVLTHLGDSARLPFAAERLQPWTVLLQVKGDGDEDLADRLYGFLTEAGVDDEDIGYAPLPALKAIRHSITEASNARVRACAGKRLSFDTAVPPGHFGAYLDELAGRLASDYSDVELWAFGHAGVGGAHLHLIGESEAMSGARVKELVSLVFDVTEAHGGTFSAEHGVGPKWGAEFKRRAPKPRVQALREAKRRYDPACILNPRSFGLCD